MSTFETEALALVKKQFEAYNRRNIDDFVSCFSENIVTTKEGHDKPLIQGIQAFREYYAKIFNESPKLHATLLGRKIEEPYIVDHEQVTGRAETTGSLSAEAHYEIKNGRICSVHFKFL